MQRLISVRNNQAPATYLKVEEHGMPRHSSAPFTITRPCTARGYTSTVGLCVLAVIVVCTLLTALNVYELHRIQTQHISLHDIASEVEGRGESREQKPVFLAYGRRVDSGYLRHVFAIFDRLGFERGGNESEWDVLWAHDYPFRAMYPKLRKLKPHQKVNHFPGSGYVTNKVDLATSNLPHIPLAFKIPADKEKLLEHAKKNPETLFVQKSNNHRGIHIQKVGDLDLETNGSFVQEYISKPFLVDGYKFDIGLYTVLTSVDPLRVFIYNGDVLFRFCPVKYHPFDAEVLDKYVVGDDYLPTWNVTSLKKYYVDLGLSMKESFNAYVRSLGKDPSKVWDQVDDAIRQVYLKKESSIVQATLNYASKRNFFEMVRFDFVVDEDLNVFVMEANMSPNLSSAHFPPNRLLYEQVIYNILGLVGVGTRTHSDSLQVKSNEERSMQVAEKNLMVFPDVCAKQHCVESCTPPECQLCKPCLTDEMKQVLSDAYLEHVNRMDCKRIFPPIMTREAASKSFTLEDYTPENQLMYRWFQGKCLLDPTWCS